MEKKENTSKNTDQQKEHFAKVGERIRILRYQKGSSIKDMEELLELPSGTFHNIEHGKGGSGVSLLAIITHFTNEGYSLKWLLDYDNENHFKKDEDQIYLDIDKSRLIDIADEFTSLTKNLTSIVDKYK